MTSEATQRWRRSHPDEARDATRRATANWRASHPGARRNTDLRTKYGITLDDHDRMYAEQGGRCAGCGREMAQFPEAHVDHCHASGAVRGLLCKGCNLILGYAADSPETLRALAEYLQRLR